MKSVMRLIMESCNETEQQTVGVGCSQVMKVRSLLSEQDLNVTIAGSIHQILYSRYIASGQIFLRYISIYLTS